MEVAIPSSLLINENDEKLKTYKIGTIARALAIFRVKKIYIYRDPALDESEFIEEILRYLETPQYLRKYLFPIKDSLRYVGVLPPLKIPSHKPKHLKVGEVREGVIRKVAPDGTLWADIGLDALALFKGKAKKGARVTVRISSMKPLVVEEVEPNEYNEYWGYKVKRTELEKVINKENAVIMSRRCGIPKLEEVMDVKDPLLIFGSPNEGVQEIAEKLGIKLSGRCWNIIPNQGSRTVRVEEAIYSALAIINYLKYWGSCYEGT